MTVVVCSWVPYLQIHVTMNVTFSTQRSFQLQEKRWIGNSHLCNRYKHSGIYIYIYICVYIIHVIHIFWVGLCGFFDSELIRKYEFLDIRWESVQGVVVKSLDRPGRKQATPTKLGIYSASSPRSSIHFLARCYKFARHSKNKKKLRSLSVQPGLRSSNDLFVGRKMTTL